MSNTTGSFESLPANRTKGKMAWIMRSALAASVSASILKFRWIRSDGERLGLNVRVLEPTDKPVVSASVTLASHESDVTC